MLSMFSSIRKIPTLKINEREPKLLWKDMGTQNVPTYRYLSDYDSMDVRNLFTLHQNNNTVRTDKVDISTNTFEELPDTTSLTLS